MIQILTRVLIAIVFPMTVLIVADFLWERRPFQPPPPPPPTNSEVSEKAVATIESSRLQDLSAVIADDGEGSDEVKLFLGHAYLNVADKTGIPIARLFEHKTILSAPSEEGHKWPRYLFLAMTGSDENLARAQKMAARLLSGNGRQEDWKTRPCLRFVTKVIRPKKIGTVQSPDTMRKDGLVLLYENKDEHTMFFGPTGSTVCK